MTTEPQDCPAATTVALNQLPALGAELDGGLFGGVITRKDGVHCAVVLLGAKPDKGLPWKRAREWAESAEGELMTRPVGALLFATLPDQFEKTWHWLGEEDGESAWHQVFYYGHQGISHKSYEGHARAVRLIPLAS